MIARLFDNFAGVLVAILYVIVVAVALALNYAVARVVVALSLVFLLPGYAITAAVFPRSSLGIVERLVFAISASLATVILGGLVLNMLPWGMQASSWAVLLAGITVVATLVAWVRRHRDAIFRGRREEGVESRKESEARYNPPRNALPTSAGFKFHQPLLIGLAVLVVGAALELARIPAPAQGFQGYTLLWILPGEASSPHIVHLGISSKEFAPTSYKLQVKVNGHITHEWPLIELKPNMQWENQVDLAPEQTAKGLVEANLYRLDQPEKVYRQVMLRPNQQETR